MSKNTTMQRLSVPQWPISVLAFWQCMPLSTEIHKNFLTSQKHAVTTSFLCCNSISYTPSYYNLPLLHGLYAKGNVYTSSQADNSPQALPPPHDDGGQNLASQKAVLDTCGQGVETLVTQHCYLVMQSAATHWKLERGMYTGQAEIESKWRLFDISDIFECAIQ